MKSDIFVLCLISIFGICYGAVVKQWKTLDAANLDTINRQTRKALLDSMTSEMATAKSDLDLIEPQIIECQEKINNTLGPCSTCVNDHCQKRLDQCAVDFNLPSSAGLSVFSTNINGKSKVTICSLTAENSKSCSTIMSPNQVFVTSVSNMGDILRVNLQSAITDLGGNIVTFIGNTQNFIQTINDTEVAMAMNDVMDQLQVSMNGINRGVHSMVDGLNTGLAQMSENLASGLQMMELGLSQMVNGFNRQYTDFSTQFHKDMGLMGNDMSGLGTSLGSIGHTIGNAMQNIFGPAGLFGRRKRAVTTSPQPMDPTTTFTSGSPSTASPIQPPMVEIPALNPNLDCLMIVENSTACAYYKEMCPSCSDVIHSPKDDIMTKVCGADIVGKTMLVKERMQELTEIYDQILSARNLISKVEFDKSTFDEITMSFSNVYVTAKVRGQIQRFPLTGSELTMLDLKRTGADIAKHILKLWLPAPAAAA